MRYEFCSCSFFILFPSNSPTIFMKASTFALAPLLLATSSQGALTILFGADELKECDQARIQWGGADLPRDSQENVIGSYEVQGELLNLNSLPRDERSEAERSSQSLLHTKPMNQLLISIGMISTARRGLSTLQMSFASGLSKSASPPVSLVVLLALLRMCMLSSTLAHFI